jgi:hypothetical protein
MFARWGMFVCLMGIASASYAGSIVSAPNLKVAENDPNLAKYPVPITIAGDDQISSFTLGFVAGDGGPELGGTETIRVHSVDYQLGTLFSGLPIFSNENPKPPTTSASGVVVAMGTFPATNVEADGILATIYLDLTGASLGARALQVNFNGLSNAQNASASLLDLTFVNGSLEIVPVPEPQGVQLALAGLGIGVFLYGFVARKNRSAAKG